MSETKRPLVCRGCREAMPDVSWRNPCPHWKETPEYVARIEADLADYNARHETSLEVIRAREQEVERKRVEIERLRAVIDAHLAESANDADEIEKMRAERDEWKQRSVGGLCRILSDPDCDCSLCQRDREIERLRARLERVRHDSDFQAGEQPTTVNDYLSLLSAHIVDFLPAKWSLGDEDDEWLAAWEIAARPLIERLKADGDYARNVARQIQQKLRAVSLRDAAWCQEWWPWLESDIQTGMDAGQ